MVRLNKIYTKKGDLGETRLAGGQKIKKNSLRIEAYGTADELNSVLGYLAEGLRENSDMVVLVKKIYRIQNELFNLGAQLAVLPQDRRVNTPVITKKNIQTLETELDEMNTILPELKSFILPGGGELSARAHLARTVCRRLERRVVELCEHEKLDGTEIPYINRLSDWLFVFARYLSKMKNVKENLWEPDKD